jgi:uncharacterized membrane protein
MSMSPEAYSLIRALHFLGWSIWIGALQGTMGMLIHRDSEPLPDAKTRLGQAARRAALVADIGFTLALIMGLTMAFGPQKHIKEGWMHLKLLAVLVIVGAHVLVRIKAKRATRGEGTFPKPLGAVVGLMAIAAVMLAVFRPWS